MLISCSLAAIRIIGLALGQTPAACCDQSATGQSEVGANTAQPAAGKYIENMLTEQEPEEGQEGEK